MSCMTLSSRQKPLFPKIIPCWHLLFLLCSCFCAHTTTLLLKILGGWMHGLSSHLKFGWTVPQPVPPRSPPMISSIQSHVSNLTTFIQYHLSSLQAHSSNLIYPILVYIHPMSSIQSHLSNLMYPNSVHSISPVQFHLIQSIVWYPISSNTNSSNSFSSNLSYNASNVYHPSNIIPFHLIFSYPILFHPISSHSVSEIYIHEG